MKKLITNLSILGGIYLVYRLIIFFTILVFNNSKYGLNTLMSDVNYGSDSKSKQLIILGSSNTRYDYNYKTLSDSLKDRSVHSVSSSTPFGLYFTLEKFINSKWNTKDNVVIVDMPYSLYSEDQFLPLTSTTMRLMTYHYVNKLLVTHPRELFSYAFNESYFHGEMIDTMKIIFNNYRHDKNNRTQKDRGLEVSPDQNFKDGYSDCKVKYVKDMHNIQDVSYSEKYLSSIKSYIGDHIKCKVYYVFPEINKNNYELSLNTINAYTKNFEPINTFESSQFANDEMYDQYYHLNKCGADVNTQNLLKCLKKIGITN